VRAELLVFFYRSKSTEEWGHYPLIRKRTYVSHINDYVGGVSECQPAYVRHSHRLNMELDLRGLFWLLCKAVLIG
jgi:hypothetical protein